MRNPRLGRWNSWQDDLGLLFFGQRIEELLFDYSLDTYKAPALNTLTRAYELHHVIAETLSGAVRESAVMPVARELAASLRSDSAARAVLGKDWEYYADLRDWGRASLPESTVRVSQLISELEDRYEDALVQEVHQVIPAGREKYRLDRLTTDLVVHWMHKGFSSDYIFWRARQFFFAVHGDPIEGTASLERFLSHFDREEREWKVLFRASASLAHLREVFPTDLIRLYESAPAEHTQSRRESEFLQTVHEGVYLEITIQALDARSARNRADKMLDSLVNLARFHVHRAPMDWEGDALVYGADAGPLVLKASTPPIRKHSEPQLRHVSEPVVRTFSAFSSRRVGTASWRRATAAVGLHSAAQRSQSIEAQLFSLWSALESLLPVENDQATISQVISTVVPLLSRSYPRKLLTDLHVSLSRCIGRTYYPVLETVSEGEEEEQRCGALVTLAKYEESREKLYAEARFNPLLKFRLFQVHSKLDSPRAILETIEEHEQRVTWHLHRIYRCRNRLVHTGLLLPYYETLVENLHSYLHTAIRQLEAAALREPKPVDLDAVFLRAGLEHRRHIDFLRKSQGSALNSDTVLDMLFGPKR